MKIYDFCNDSVEIEIPEDKIDRLRVTILTGDEIVEILTTDNKYAVYDAGELLGSGRIFPFRDGVYELIDKKDIRKWLEYESVGVYPDCGTAAYERARLFGVELSL